MRRFASLASLASILSAAALVTLSVAACASTANGTARTSPQASAPPDAQGCPARITPTTDAHGNGVHVAIDYVDAIHFQGRQYVTLGEDALPAADVGEPLGRVRCTLSGPLNVDPDYRMQDGDATFVAAGSQIYAVKGVPSDTEVAAVRDGVMRAYRAHP